LEQSQRRGSWFTTDGGSDEGKSSWSCFERPWLLEKRATKGSKRRKRAAKVQKERVFLENNPCLRVVAGWKPTGSESGVISTYSIEVDKKSNGELRKLWF
jgi:hypothetical protein